MTPFDAALKSLAAENATVSPPADLETRVMREFDAVPRIRLWRMATAAVALSFASLLLLRIPAPPPPEQPFVQIPYVAPPAPYERLAVVRQYMPVAALIAAGVRVPDTGAAIQADLLVGQDGRPLAIRLVSKP